MILARIKLDTSLTTTSITVEIKLNTIVGFNLVPSRREIFRGKKKTVLYFLALIETGAPYKSF